MSVAADMRRRISSDATLAHRTRRAVALSQRVGEGLGVRVSGDVSILSLLSFRRRPRL